jgi:hypothetical protein
MKENQERHIGRMANFAVVMAMEITELTPLDMNKT